jgi:hypothetical protein
MVKDGDLSSARFGPAWRENSNLLTPGGKDRSFALVFRRFMVATVAPDAGLRKQAGGVKLYRPVAVNRWFKYRKL